MKNIKLYYKNKLEDEICYSRVTNYSKKWEHVQ